MNQQGPVPDKLWKVLLTRLDYIETLCIADKVTTGFDPLQQAVGITGCMVYRFEA